MCSGTLLALHQLGHEVHVGSLTLGDRGSVDLSAEEIRRIRHREATKAFVEKREPVFSGA